MKTGSLRRLLGYTFRYKWSFFISVIGFISFAFADIAAVEWIRRIIGFINSEEENFSSFLALSLILIALGRGIGFFVGNYFMSRVGFGIVHDLRAELFQKLHDLPKSYFDANQSGQLINRITFTTTQVSGAASNAVKTLIREGFLLIGLFVYLLICWYACPYSHMFAHVRNCLKNDSPRHVLPNRAIESFWDALWLELWPFLYVDFKRY